MRIVVVSDTHRDTWNLERVVEAQKRADYFIHLGDGEDDLETVAAVHPDKSFLFVRGNCDFGSQSPMENELIASGKRILYTHGHQFYVKYGLSELISHARSNQADIVLYGHTHVANTSYEDGLYIMNPGSLGHPREGCPSYGVIDITPAGIVLNIVEI